MKSLFLFPLLALFAYGQTPNVYRIEHINLPKADASKLMRDTVLTDTDPWETMSAWLKNGTATRLSGATVSSTDDEPFSASSVVEWIYPTEFDPAELPGHLEIEGEVTRDSIPMTTTTPTAFETRNVGTSIEFRPDDTGNNPSSNNNQQSNSNQLSLSSELVQFRNNIVIGKDESREWLPRFHTRRVVQWFAIPLDRWLLLSASESPDPDITTTTWIRRSASANPIVIADSEPDETNIALVAEWFTIENFEADQWLSQLGAEPDQSAAYESLQKLVTDGKATPIATRLFIARSGGEAVSRASEEHIYATEADPAELSNSIGVTIIDGANITTEATPTAFETRNLGPEIAVTPKALGDGEFISCHIEVSLTTHDFDHATGIAPALIHMPLFISTHIKSSTLLQNGMPAFIGSITTPVRDTPALENKISNTPETPPKYKIGETPRTVVFLTARMQP